MTFYSKLSKELKRQFKTSDIPIPDTRAKCVAVAQRVWEGLYGPSEKRSSKDQITRPSSGSNYPRPNSGRDRRDQYHLDHRSRDDRNKEKPRNDIRKERPVCFSCNKPGHYATTCPDQNQKGVSTRISTKPKVQAVQQGSSSPTPDIETSSRAGTEQPYVQTEPEDSEDSSTLN